MSERLAEQAVAAALKPRAAAPPPALPANWTAVALLSPFGDALHIMPNHDQLIVANLEYAYSADGQFLQVEFYLLESLTYFRFLFTNTAEGGVFYWIEAQPGGPAGAAHGPFKTPLNIPSPDFLADRGATFGNQWPLSGAATNGWVIATPAQPDIPAHGTWFSLDAATGALARVLNLDSDNPQKIPVLGACYFATIASFAEQPQSGRKRAMRELAARAKTSPGVIPPSLMVTQRDLQTAFANPIASAPCTLADIQAVLPGLSGPPGPSAPLPQWSDKVYIQGWTIGCDFIPYYTQVFYWWSYKHQRSMFVGYGPNPGSSTYRDRTDTVLYNGYTTSPLYYEVSDGHWVSTCQPCLPGVGIPRPDFIQAMGGVIHGVITGNAAFGLSPGESLSLIGVNMDRGPNSKGELVTSLFWFWFDNQQRGVLFSEGNFVDTVVAHDLQVIDYSYFERDADDHVNQNSFEDPCFVPNCAAPAPQQASRAAPVPRLA